MVLELNDAGLHRSQAPDIQSELGWEAREWMEGSERDPGSQ